jgi:c(7)-type cytochrome triheme protein
MKKVAILLTVLIVMAFIGSALAVPPGKTIEYTKSPMGKVIFDGKIHADKGKKCNDCHTKIFQMKTGTAKIKAPHKPGELCGVCHNGEVAFLQSDMKNCARCHKK